MKICVMGTGGMGGIFGASAARAGHDVTFIARGPHLDAMREHGLRVKTAGGEILVKPAKATDDPAQVGEVDLVLFCVKAYHAESAAQQIKPVIGPDTVVIPALNGVEHLDVMTRALGVEHVLGGYAIVSAHREAPGTIVVNTPRYNLYFGELGGGSAERCQSLHARLDVDCIQHTPDITKAMWRKLAAICGAGVCSVVRGTYGMVLGCPETAALFVQAANEVAAVARAKHVALEMGSDRDIVAPWEPLKQVKPSMLVDLERGNRLEVEWLNGSVSRMGKALNVPTPVNDYVYACLKPWADGNPGNRR